MFTGIIETLGTITNINNDNGNVYISVESSLASELKIDQSIAHNGICLTVINIENNNHTVCAVKETIDKTTISFWKKNDMLNLERCMQLNGRLDGHIVQGHIDGTAICKQKKLNANNWHFVFEIDEKYAQLIIEKGSVCINGISLTCFNITSNTFEVTIIPYTMEHTTMKYLQENENVNIEFDVIGKYVARMHQQK